MAFNGRILEWEGGFYLKLHKEDAAEAGLRKGQYAELEITKKDCL